MQSRSMGCQQDKVRAFGQVGDFIVFMGSCGCQDMNFVILWRGVRRKEVRLGVSVVFRWGIEVVQIWGVIVEKYLRSKLEFLEFSRCGCGKGEKGAEVDQGRFLVGKEFCRRRGWGKYSVWEFWRRQQDINVRELVSLAGGIREGQGQVRVLDEGCLEYGGIRGLACMGVSSKGWGKGLQGVGVFGKLGYFRLFYYFLIFRKGLVRIWFLVIWRKVGLGGFEVFEKGIFLGSGQV